MTAPHTRLGDPELAMIETLELAIAEPGHTFFDLDGALEATLEGNLFADLTDRTLDGSCSIVVKPMGRSAVRRFRERQADPVRRKRALPDKYLRYAWEQHEAGTHATPDGFLAMEPHWCGDVYTLKEIERAGSWLYERGLIRGELANNSDAPIQVEITPRGETVVESRKSVNDSTESASTGSRFNTTITGGNVNIAQQSRHVTQTQNNRSGAAAALEFIDAVLGRLEGLPAAQRSDVEAAIGELRQEAEGPARGQWLRDLSNKVFTAAVTAGAVSGVNDLAAGLFPHLQTVLQALGS